MRIECNSFWTWFPCFTEEKEHLSEEGEQKEDISPVENQIQSNLSRLEIQRADDIKGKGVNVAKIRVKDEWDDCDFELVKK